MPQSDRRIILTDVDGVLLEWENHFANWMLAKGYQQKPGKEKIYSMDKRYGLTTKKKEELIKEFNNSAWMSTQTPLPESQTWVKLLHAEGWTFIPITSQTKDIPAQELRKRRLQELFGGTVFENFFILDTGEDKDSALAEFHGTGLWWVEDKPENALLGLEYGLRPLLMDQKYNCKFKHPKIKRVSNWREIRTIINSNG
jgi:uncharacterized HAD superfamily protein